MDEQQETTQEVVEKKGLGEMDLIVVLILIGLLAIAIFIWLFFGGGANETEMPIDEPVQVVTNETMTPETFSDVDGRDESVLGIAVHKDLGRYFTQAGTGMALYTVVGECEVDCYINRIPYYLPGSIDDFTPSENLDALETGDSLYQYVWKGNPLYIYTGDTYEGSITGHEEGGFWQLARP